MVKWSFAKAAPEKVSVTSRKFLAGIYYIVIQAWFINVNMLEVRAGGYERDSRRTEFQGIIMPNVIRSVLRRS